MMQVLGDVGQLGEVAEGADYDDGRRGRQHIERGFQLGARLGIAVTTKTDGRLPDAAR